MIQCPYCKRELPLSLFTRELGRRTSERKVLSSRENGKKGGRPKQKGKKR